MLHTSVACQHHCNGFILKSDCCIWCGCFSLCRSVTEMSFTIT